MAALGYAGWQLGPGPAGRLLHAVAAPVAFAAAGAPVLAVALADAVAVNLALMLAWGQRGH